MARMNKKYLEDFDKLCRDWEKLKMKPNRQALDLIMQDLEEMEYDLKNMEF
ncbi:MAG: hypothetical protein K1000chlam3_00753 [Chlamydiae bacterium]|nr:hypothetical protein [Chlamydiota bacterium]